MAVFDWYTGDKHQNFMLRMPPLEDVNPRELESAVKSVHAVYEGSSIKMERERQAKRVREWLDSVEAPSE